jgi:thiamine transporter ThiT
MDLTAKATLKAGEWMRKTITGNLHTYFIWAISGVILISLLIWQMNEVVMWGLIILALGAILTVFIYQLVLNLLNKSEPLKRIDRD